ncbi:50S ribosomal protein L13 [Candidatus Peregrinibacteria bacterium HGW-Peregrinibacteria-1]|jgi:large subunit ribosomal protein L13|nr:MAG: 50S ribosomal protein L13 [Candidatus Peregrinibacteria bacterium HGW-Peregrinibacteria-1]
MQKSFVAHAKDLTPKWYLIDAENKTLGRLATVIANKLRGKDKPIFSPHLDCGDNIIVVNVDKIHLSSNKTESKMYYRHSGFPSGFKEENAQSLMDRNPGKVLELAVSGMLPKNKLRKVFMQKLKLYPGAEHPHEAQTPEKLTIDNI